MRSVALFLLLIFQSLTLQAASNRVEGSSATPYEGPICFLTNVDKKTFSLGAEQDQFRLYQLMEVEHPDKPKLAIAFDNGTQLVSSTIDRFASENYRLLESIHMRAVKGHVRANKSMGYVKNYKLMGSYENVTCISHIWQANPQGNALIEPEPVVASSKAEERLDKLCSQNLKVTAYKKAVDKIMKRWEVAQEDL